MPVSGSSLTLLLLLPPEGRTLKGRTLLLVSSRLSAASNSRTRKTLGRAGPGSGQELIELGGGDSGGGEGPAAQVSVLSLIGKGS